MIGVAQNHLGTRRMDLSNCQAFDGALRANRHEAWQLDRSVWRAKNAAPRRAIATDAQQFE